ncbi:MAG: hypothetical protein ACM3NV_09105 [Syntrophothermus sp.]
MSWPPRNVSPPARARRALLLDLCLAALVAIVALQLAAGLGVVAFVALPVLLVGLIWIGVEAVARGVGRRRGRSRVL